MNLKNKKSVILMLLLLMQCIHMTASDKNNKEADSNISVSVRKDFLWGTFGLFAGYFLGRFLYKVINKSKRQNNDTIYVQNPNITSTINMGNRIKTVKIISFQPANINIIGRGNTNNCEIVSNHTIPCSHHFENNVLKLITNGNITVNVPSDQMIIVSNPSGHVSVNNVNSVLVNITTAGSIDFEDIKCGVFGHTSCGHISMQDSQYHRNMRFVNLSTLAGNIRCKVATNNQARQVFSLQNQITRIDGSNISGIVSIGGGNLILEEV